MWRFPPATILVPVDFGEASHRAVDVAAALGQSAASMSPRARAAERVVSNAIEPLDAVIRQHVEAALRQTNGRVEGPHGAARLLRINPHTLRARMRKLKIEWRSFRQPPVCDSRHS